MYLLIDIGGTQTRLAISPDGTTFGQPKIVPTPQDFNSGIDQIKTLVHQLSNNNIKAAAIGVPGVLNENKDALINIPHLSDWEDKPLKQQLEQALNTTVHLANDADLAGLGEAVTGAGQEYNIVVYLTISTGVGGTRIVNKKIDVSAVGFEPGHQIIMSAKNKTLTLEDCVSGSGLKNRHGMPAEQITDPATWDEVIKLLATGLNNVTVHWSPHCIVLGGSIMKSIALDQLQKQFEQTMQIFPTVPQLKLAALGDSAGLAGALTYLQTTT